MEDKEQLGGKISEDDKEKILKIVEDKLTWLQVNEEASSEEMKSAKKDIEDIAQPIIASLYQNQQQQSSDNSHQSDEL